jgi:hypothetical protein
MESSDKKTHTAEYHKAYHRANRDRKSAYYKKYYQKNREKKVAAVAEYRKINPEKAKACNRKSGPKSFQKSKARIYAYRTNRYATNLQVKIADVLRKRLKCAIKPESKYKSALELLGCSIEFFRQYIADRFVAGMSWENHGRYTWHIDHIIPCASFDLTKEEEQKKCFHYTNLQPLFAFENISKGAKIPKAA